MSIAAIVGFAFQFLAELLKLNETRQLTAAQAQAAVDAAIASLQTVGPPS